MRRVCVVTGIKLFWLLFCFLVVVYVVVVVVVL